MAYMNQERKKAEQSGYVSCSCRDCMETAIISKGESVAYCSECKEAGCPDYQGVKGMSQECQAPGAYGGDEPYRYAGAETR